MLLRQIVQLTWWQFHIFLSNLFSTSTAKRVCNVPSQSLFVFVMLTLHSTRKEEQKNTHSIRFVYKFAFINLYWLISLMEVTGQLNWEAMTCSIFFFFLSQVVILKLIWSIMFIRNDRHRYNEIIFPNKVCLSVQ